MKYRITVYIIATIIVIGCVTVYRSSDDSTIDINTSDNKGVKMPVNVAVNKLDSAMLDTN